MIRSNRNVAIDDAIKWNMLSTREVLKCIIITVSTLSYFPVIL